MNGAVSTNRSRFQHIDLGIHTEACMTVPGTCGTSGGAISLWYRMTECSSLGAIVKTFQGSHSGGTSIHCEGQQVMLVAQTEFIIVLLLLSIAVIQSLFIFLVHKSSIFFKFKNNNKWTQIYIFFFIIFIVNAFYLK